MPKRKDAWLIAAVLALAAVLLLVSRLMPKTDLSTKTADATLAPDAVEYLDATPAPQGNDIPEESAEPEIAGEPAAAAEPEQPQDEASDAPQQNAAVGPMPAPRAEDVKGYVVISVGNRQYGDPIAMDRDKVITIRQEDGKVNKVHITPEKVYMESSTCENQDCVAQGEITLDNYKKRILSTYVICLPNEVTIELVPVE